jgi:uncharacterized integral membrane protein
MARRIKWITLVVLAVLVLVVLAQNSAPVTLALFWMSFDLPLFVGLLASMLIGMLVGALLAAVFYGWRRIA